MFVKDDQTSAEDDLNRPSFHSENVADTNIDDGSQNQPSKQYSSETDAYYPIPKYLKYLILLPFIFPVASVLVSSLLSIVHGASFSSSDSPLGFIFLFSGIIFAIPSLTIARNIFRKDINFPKWFFWNLLLILPIIYMIIAYSVTSASVLGNSIKMIFGSIFMFTGIISLMLPRIIMESYPVTLNVIMLAIYCLIIILYPKKHKLTWFFATLSFFSLILSIYLNFSPLFNLAQNSHLSITSIYLILIALIFGILAIRSVKNESDWLSFPAKCKIPALYTSSLLLLVIPLVIIEMAYTTKNIVKPKEVSQSSSSASSLKGVGYEQFYYRLGTKTILNNTDGKSPLVLKPDGSFSEDQKYYLYSLETKNAKLHNSKQCVGQQLCTHLFEKEIRYLDLDTQQDKLITLISGESINEFTATFEGTNIAIEYNAYLNNHTKQLYDLEGNQISIDNELPVSTATSRTNKEFVDTYPEHVKSHSGKYELQSDQNVASPKFFLHQIGSDKKVELPWPSYPKVWLGKSDGLLFSYHSNLYLIDMEGNYKKISDDANISQIYTFAN